MKKRLLALILALSCFLSVLTPTVHAEEPKLTRIEWVQQLVTTFDMTVEDDNYPDNYYSDIAKDIIEVPEGTEVTVTDDTSISITDCPVTITQGDVFVVYLNEIPVPYIAGRVYQDALFDTKKKTFSGV